MAFLFICGIAGSMIFFTQGYRFNIKDMKIQKTGILSLEYLPVDAQIFVNNQQYKAHGSYAQNFLPGRYLVEIKKDGLTTWERNLTIDAESVNSLQNIVLFKTNTDSVDLTDNDKIALLNSPTDILASNAANSLYYSSNELWAGNTLVTRLSSPILKAVWYPDLSHIIYQQGNEIRVIEETGYNDILLAKLSQDTATSFAIGNKGTELYFLDQGNYKMAKIR